MNKVTRFTSEEIIAILSLSPNATAIYASEQIIIQAANDAMIAFWDKDRSIVGYPLEEVVPELKGKPFVNIIKNVWHSGITYEAHDSPALLKTGDQLHTFYFDFVYRAILDDEGKTTCILHTATDVTERNINRLALQQAKEQEEDLFKEKNINEELAAINKRLHTSNVELQVTQRNLYELTETLEDRVQRRTTKLKESQIKLEQAIETGRMGTWSINPVTRQVSMSDFIRDLFGFRPDHEILLSEILHAIHPEYRALLTSTLSGQISSDTKYPITNQITEQTKWIRATGRPFFDQSNQLVEYSGMVIDISEQVNDRMDLERIIAEKTALEHDLRQNQQRLQSILDTMAEGVGIIDSRGNLIYVNAMAQQIFGLKADELTGLSFFDAQWSNQQVNGLPLPDDEHPVAQMIADSRAVHDQEIGVQPISGERIFLSINAAPIFGNQSELTGGIVTFMDVTHRRKLMQQKDEFISVASHELKTPLTSLKAALQLLDRMRDNPNPDMMSKLINQSNKSLTKLSNLVADLLNVNRITQGQLHLRKSPFMLSDVIEDCCHHILSAGTHTITVKGDSAFIVNADEQQIDQVLINFINNAVKYAPESKEIIISIEQTDSHARISVQDNGPGVPEAKIPHLFDRYFRGDYSGIQFSGLGLGLYICAEIIKKHGGEIGVNSIEGNGSTFWFTLPR
jgi:PAS domain S-box-containing protein